MPQMFHEGIGIHTPNRVEFPFQLPLKLAFQLRLWHPVTHPATNHPAQIATQGCPPWTDGAADGPSYIAQPTQGRTPGCQTNAP